MEAGKTPEHTQDPNTPIGENIEATADSCRVCFEPLVEGDEIITLPCGHIFHYQCIMRWLLESHNKCPLCNIITNPQNYK